MNERTMFTPSAVDRLIDAHRIKPDFDLHHALSVAARMHEIFSHPNRLNDLKIWLDEVLKTAQNLVQTIDAYGQTIANMRAITRTQLERTYILYRRPSDNIEQMRKYVRAEAEGTANQAQRAIKLAKDFHKHLPNGYEMLIDLLINIYLSAVDNPNLTLKGKTQKDYGEFFNFVNGSLLILGIKRGRLTLWNNLQKHRKNFDSEEQSRNAIRVVKDSMELDDLCSKFLYSRF